MTSNHRSQQLERTLGAREALTIGIGTMVGAGIFVFPGIAAGQAGPAAALSFAIGALVALAVALPASELATAMPRSGGGYFFVSRGLGSWAGALIGVGQWLGLVFASAFYLVGFGEYAAEALSRASVQVGATPSLFGLGAVALLLLVGVVGAEKTGGLQNALVGLLLAVLTGFLGYGAVQAIGLAEGPLTLESMAPYGGVPIFTTAALVFTSYLGFVQVATVAGEVEQPGRNLPRAMVGSVIVVGLLYVATLLVSTGILGSERLGEAGETALVTVGQELLGPAGALLILVCGLLATLSSANASLLSASRAVFALSRDGLVPRVAARVNERFGTPHVSLALAGLPTGALIALGGTELLAEVASLLHLVMYGAICVALLVLRHRAPAWYAPSFRAPGGPVVPAFGAVASFALIAFMQPLSIAVGAGLFVLAALWHVAYGRGTVIQPPPSPAVIPPRRAISDARILVPYAMPNASPPPPALLSFLSDLEVLLVGTYETPRATEPEQAREELGDEADEELERGVAQLREHIREVESRQVFTPSPRASLARVVVEESVQAVLFPAEVDRIQRVLVAVGDDPEIETLAAFVASLVRREAQIRSIELIHVRHEPAAEAGEEQSEDGLSSVREALVRRGVRRSLVQIRRERGDAIEVLVGAAEDVDLVVAHAAVNSDDGFDELTVRLVDETQRSVLLLCWRDDQPHDSEPA